MEPQRSRSATAGLFGSAIILLDHLSIFPRCIGSLSVAYIKCQLCFPTVSFPENQASPT